MMIIKRFFLFKLHQIRTSTKMITLDLDDNVDKFCQVLARKDRHIILKSN